jgi:hypothetical protein
MKTHFALSMPTLLAISSLGCGGRASSAGNSGGSLGGGSAGSSSTASCPSPVSDAGASPLADVQAPLEHRASPCCSSQRGPGPSAQPYSDGFAAEVNGHVACRSDSDCSAGPNGRCFPFEGLVGPGGCSYDECATDSDCASGEPVFVAARRATTMRTCARRSALARSIRIVARAATAHPPQRAVTFRALTFATPRSIRAPTTQIARS